MIIYLHNKLITKLTFNLMPNLNTKLAIKLTTKLAKNLIPKRTPNLLIKMDVKIIAYIFHSSVFILV